MITTELFESIYALAVCVLSSILMAAIQFLWSACLLLRKSDERDWFPVQALAVVQVIAFWIAVLLFYDVALFAAQQAGWVQ